MKKHIIIMVIFFALLSLSASIMVSNISLLGDVIRGEDRVSLIFEVTEDVSESDIIDVLKEMPSFSNKKMKSNKEKIKMTVKIFDTKDILFDEVINKMDLKFADNVKFIEYAIFEPSKENSKIIAFYIGISVVFFISILRVIKQIFRIKEKSETLNISKKV